MQSIVFHPILYALHSFVSHTQWTEWETKFKKKRTSNWLWTISSFGMLTNLWIDPVLLAQLNQLKNVRLTPLDILSTNVCFRKFDWNQYILTRLTNSKLPTFLIACMSRQLQWKLIKWFRFGCFFVVAGKRSFNVHELLNPSPHTENGTRSNNKESTAQRRQIVLDNFTLDNIIDKSNRTKEKVMIVQILTNWATNSRNF